MTGTVPLWNDTEADSRPQNSPAIRPLKAVVNKQTAKEFLKFFSAFNLLTSEFQWKKLLESHEAFSLALLLSTDHGGLCCGYPGEKSWHLQRGYKVENSILDAIRQGHWDYEPTVTRDDDYSSTSALPGSEDKLQVLASRIAEGLPLWHPEDRITYDDSELPE